MSAYDLIAALERATGPDASLDLTVARAAGHAVYDRGKLGWTWRKNGTGQHLNVPRYTASIDAALTVVPEEHAVCVQYSSGTQGEAWLYPPDNIEDVEYYSRAATPTLALCVAALCAREAGR